MVKEFIFGSNPLARILEYYLVNDGHIINSYVVNEQFLPLANEDFDIPVRSIEEVISEYGSETIGVYVTVAYAHMNSYRRQIYKWLHANEIKILSYYHPSSVISENANLGEGNICLENSVIQPFVSIGDGNIIWNNASICHDTIIGSFNYLAPSATVAGKSFIGDMNFIGANATISNHIRIGNSNLIGSGAFVDKSLESGMVFFPSRGQISSKLKSDEVTLK
ncbi:MAG: acetyltransferase [Sphaerochaeta sp.]